MFPRVDAGQLVQGWTSARVRTAQIEPGSSRCPTGAGGAMLVMRWGLLMVVMVVVPRGPWATVRRAATTIGSRSTRGGGNEDASYAHSWRCSCRCGGGALDARGLASDACCGRGAAAGLRMCHNKARTAAQQHRPLPLREDLLRDRVANADVVLCDAVGGTGGAVVAAGDGGGDEMLCCAHHGSAQNE
jgi:hypothetical protein